jgi:hypothetical protein
MNETKRAGNTKVFLSYAQADKDTARYIADALKRSGVSTLFDEWELQLGDSIVQHIERGVESSDFVLVLLSPAAVQSHWIQKEWTPHSPGNSTIGPFGFCRFSSQTATSLRFLPRGWSLTFVPIGRPGCSGSGSRKRSPRISYIILISICTSTKQPNVIPRYFKSGANCDKKKRLSFWLERPLYAWDCANEGGGQASFLKCEGS